MRLFLTGRAPNPEDIHISAPRLGLFGQMLQLPPEKDLRAHTSSVAISDRRLSSMIQRRVPRSRFKAKPIMFSMKKYINLCYSNILLRAIRLDLSLLLFGHTIRSFLRLENIVPLWYTPEISIVSLIRPSLPATSLTPHSIFTLLLYNFFANFRFDFFFNSV